MITHRVMPGECLASIADRYGFTNPLVIYNDPANQGLRHARTDPNVLLAGDEVAIPDAKMRIVTGATEQRYRFVVHRQPVYLKLRLVNRDGSPKSGLAYAVEYQGRVVHGTTDSGGGIVHEVPPHLPSAEVVVRDGQEDRRYQVALGYLDPVEEREGLRQRLKSLGYYVDVPGIPDELLFRYAMYAYEHAHDLPPQHYPPDQQMYHKLRLDYRS
ncbi:MAG: LysM domain-containing protein [Gemmatimonadota bacterium]